MYMLLALLSLMQAWTVLSRTPKDNIKHLQTKNGRIIIGVILGDIFHVRLGLDEGGDANAILEPYYGELIIKVGKPYLDFPSCPAVHLALNLGMKEHLDAAAFLLKNGADINRYVLPTSVISKDKFARGYPPGILFALGLGQTPLNSHAAILQRLHRSYPDSFNNTKIEQWRSESGNPPLLQLCLLIGNIDGAHVLLSEFKVSVDDVDPFGVTALHVAAWTGNVEAIIMLLHYGANPYAKDRFSRTPMHYAIMHHHAEVVHNLLLMVPISSTKTKPIHRQQLSEREVQQMLLRARYDVEDVSTSVYNMAMETFSQIKLPSDTALIEYLNQLTSRWNITDFHFNINSAARTVFTQNQLLTENTDETVKPCFAEPTDNDDKLTGWQDDHDNRGEDNNNSNCANINHTSGNNNNDTTDTNNSNCKSDNNNILDNNECLLLSTVERNADNADDVIMMQSRSIIDYSKNTDNNINNDSNNDDGNESIRLIDILDVNDDHLASTTKTSSSSSSKFFSKYFAAQRPVLISSRYHSHQHRRHLTVGQSIWAHRNKDDFLQRYGNMIITTTTSTTTTGSDKSRKHKNKSKQDSKTESMTVTDYVKRFMLFTNNIEETYNNSDSDSAHLNQQQQQQKQLLNDHQLISKQAWSGHTATASYQLPEEWNADLQTPALFAHLCSSISSNTNSYTTTDDDEPQQQYQEVLEPSLQFYIGSRHSGTGLHAHNASWNLLLAGRKRWALLAPNTNISEILDGFPSYRFSNVSSYRNVSVNNAYFQKDTKGRKDITKLTPQEWFHLIAPLLRQLGVLLEIVQYPGDVLFVPHNWHHITLNLANSIAVTQEICSVIPTDSRIPPLGYAIYGSRNDSHYGLGMYKTHIHSNYKLGITMEKLSRFPVFDFPPIT